MIPQYWFNKTKEHAHTHVIHEHQTKLPHATVNVAPGLCNNGLTQIWIRGLLKFMLMTLLSLSTFPRELEPMLHTCQEWSVRNRAQIYTQKTKVMAFFETPS